MAVASKKDLSGPPPCPLCGGESSRRLYRTNEYDVFRCRACSFIFVDTAPFQDKLADLYKEDIYQEYSFPVPNLPEKIAEETVERFFRFLPPGMAGGRLLDIGCGQGTVLHQLSKDPRAKGWKLEGIDVSEENIAKGKRVFNLDLHCGDLLRMNWPAGSFDAITLWSTIEHLSSPRPMIREIARLLRPGGLLIVTTPNSRGLLFRAAHAMYLLSDGLIKRPIKRLYNQFHVSAFTAKSLESLTRPEGLSLRLIDEYESYVTLISYEVLSPVQKLIFGGAASLADLLGKGHHELAASFVKEG